MKLYELAGNFGILMDMVENGDIEFDAIKDTLDSIESELNIKVENIVKLMKSIEGDIDTFKAEEKRISERRKTMEKRLEGLNGYLFNTLEANKIEKVQAGTFTVSVRKNPASVDVLNEEIIPPKYRKPQPDKIDKTLLSADLKQGITINGAKLINDKKTLSIK